MATPTGPTLTGATNNPVNPTNPAGGNNFAANNAFRADQQSALANGLRPQGWNQQQTQGVDWWNSLDQAGQDQFMSGMANDYYGAGNPGEGNLQEDRQASDEFWAGFPDEPATDMGPYQPPPVEPPPTGGGGGGGGGRGGQHPTDPWSQVPWNQVFTQTVYPNRQQDYDSMSDWQKWQVDNRPMGATSELQRPDDVALGGQQKDLDYNDPYTISAQGGPAPLGGLYHPFRGQGGVQAPGGDYGGNTGPGGPQPGVDAAKPDYYDMINDNYRDILGRPVGQEGYDFYKDEAADGMDSNRLSDILRDSPEYAQNNPPPSQPKGPRQYDSQKFNDAITERLTGFGISADNSEALQPALEEYLQSGGDQSPEGFRQFVIDKNFAEIRGGGGGGGSGDTLGGGITPPGGTGWGSSGPPAGDIDWGSSAGAPKTWEEFRDWFGNNLENLGFNGGMTVLPGITL